MSRRTPGASRQRADGPSHEQLVLCRLSFGALEEDDRHPVLSEFVEQHDLVGVLARESIGTVHVDELDRTLGNSITESFERGTNQRRAAEPRSYRAPPARLEVPHGVGHGVLHPDRLPPMAEPSLKDVLDAVAKLDAKVDRRFDAVEKRLGHVEKQLADLDTELTTHAKVHRKIETDITALKGRPPRTATRPARRPRAR